MDLSRYNETDIREEFAVPLLARLGYKKGTDADISREESIEIRYGRAFLGRKNPKKDPVLRGRIDYLLSIFGYTRVIVEVKAPNVDIGIDELEQALSYARHPEISASFYVVMNGNSMHIYDARFSIETARLIVIETSDLDVLYDESKNIIGVDAIKRDFRAHKIDLGRGIGRSLRSEEQIRTGILKYQSSRYLVHTAPPDTQDQILQALQSQPNLLQGMQTAILGGTIRRTDQGSIVAELKWNAPWGQLLDFWEAKRLDQVRYVCLDKDISSHPDNPSAFDYYGNFSIEEGDEIFDISKFSTVQLGVASRCELSGSAIGYFDNRRFIGTFTTSMMMYTPPDQPHISFEMINSGTIDVILEHQ